MKSKKLLALLGSSLFAISVFGTCFAKKKVTEAKADDLPTSEAYFSMIQIESSGWCYFTVKGNDGVANAPGNTAIAQSYITDTRFNFLDNIIFKTYEGETKLGDIVDTTSFSWNKWTRVSAFCFNINSEFATKFIANRVGGQNDGTTVIFNQGTTIPSYEYTAGGEASGLKTPCMAVISNSRDSGVSIQVEIIDEILISNIFRKSDREDSATGTALWYGLPSSIDAGGAANQPFNGVVAPYVYGNTLKIDGKYIGEYCTNGRFGDADLVSKAYSNTWTWWGTNEIGLAKNFDLNEVTFEKGMIIQDPNTAISAYNHNTYDLANFKSKVYKAYQLKETQTFKKDSIGKYYWEKDNTEVTKIGFSKAESGSYFVGANLTNHDYPADSVQFGTLALQQYELLANTKYYDAAGNEVDHKYGSDAYHKLASGKDFEIRVQPNNNSDLSTVRKIVIPAGTQFPSFSYIDNSVAWAGDPHFARRGPKASYGTTEDVVALYSPAGFGMKATVDAFVADNMHMSDYDPTFAGGESEGCFAYYATAKAAFNAMGTEEKAVFATHDDYADARARLEAWASANGDVLNHTSYVLDTSSFTLINNANNSTISIVLVAAVAVIICAAAVLFLKKKRA